MVQQAVQDGIGDGGFADDGVPVFDRALAGDDGGIFPIAVLDKEINMDGQAVNYDLRRLAGFLNLTDKRLDEFDEKDPRPPIDGGEESFVLMALRYMTGTKDTGESLKALRTDIKDHLLALLNLGDHPKPAISDHFKTGQR